MISHTIDTGDPPAQERVGEPTTILVRIPGALQPIGDGRPRPRSPKATRRDSQRQLLANETPIVAVDMMIAPIAVAREDPVVERNANEFVRTPVRGFPS